MLVVVATTRDRQGQDGIDSELERWRAEAVRLVAENKSLQAENNSLRDKITSLEGRIAALVAKVAKLAELAFGKKSERSKPDPGSGGSSDGSGGGTGGGGDGTNKRRRGQQRGSKGHGRTDRSNLEVEEEVYDVEEAKRHCACCGKAYVPFGDEFSEQIDWRVRLVRVVHRRRRYVRGCSCEGSPGVLAAPVPPKPIAKGGFSVNFLARLLVEKYVLGRPIERIVAAAEAEGCAVSKGTLVGLLRSLHELLKPLAAAIAAHNSSAAHLHIDETSWKVFEPVAGKDSNRWWCWVFVGPDSVVFIIDPTRSAAVVSTHLGIDLDARELEAGRHLLISSDFYAVYQSIASIDGVETLWCWAHARRWFVGVGDAHPWLSDWAEAWLLRIRCLYAAHRQLAEATSASPEAEAAAAAFSKALAEIDSTRRVQMADPSLSVIAKEELAKMEREWEGLARHGEYPEADLDNNCSERALRGPVVIRKNCYGSGAAWAADLAAETWSITATAKMAGANPLAYLTDYLWACAKAGSKAPEAAELERFLPWSAAEEDLCRWRLGQAGPGP